MVNACDIPPTLLHGTRSHTSHTPPTHSPHTQVRLCKFPRASRALVESRAVPMLSRMLRLGPASVRQVALLGLYKLANPPSTPSTLESASSALSGFHTIAESCSRSQMDNKMGGMQESSLASPPGFIQDLTRAPRVSTAPPHGMQPHLLSVDQGSMVLRQVLLSGAVPDLCKALVALSSSTASRLVSTSNTVSVPHFVQHSIR